MAKLFVLLALFLAVAALFLPLSTQLGGEYTRGVLLGTETQPKAAILFAPVLFSTLLSVLFGMKRFGRGLGVLNLLFGAASVGLMWMVYSRVDTGVTMGMGSHAAMAAGILATLAGLGGLIKPDPK